MSQHVIVGAGPVGSATAVLLAQRGEAVTLVSRSGRGPALAGVTRVAADATDAERLTELTSGAAALYNCANPNYTRWLTDWPPIANALLTAAERTGAVLAVAAPLYGYGPVSAPMTAHTPLAATHPKLRMRADMYREAVRRQEAGRIRTTEVRASDYIEANGVLSFLGAPLLAGRRAYSPAPLHVPHTWTSIADVAHTLVTAAGDERAYGRAWMVPSAEPMTGAQLARRFTEVNGAPEPKLTKIPYPVLWTTGLFQPFIKELRTTYYQFAHPFVVDASETEQVFGLRARPLEDSLREAADVVRSGAPAAR
ncbi:MAG TPA: NAD-dependent epimerase [Rugosimonospora sp.]|nr:NAD-dependent epimerase [Rugosimonospora sp.]